MFNCVCIFLHRFGGFLNIVITIMKNCLYIFAQVWLLFKRSYNNHEKLYLYINIYIYFLLGFGGFLNIVITIMKIVFIYIYIFAQVWELFKHTYNHHENLHSCIYIYLHRYKFVYILHIYFYIYNIVYIFSCRSSFALHELAGVRKRARDACWSDRQEVHKELHHARQEPHVSVFFYYLLCEYI